MLAKVLSGSVYGIEGYLVTVEVDIAAGLPALSTVGLPDTAVREARDRVVAAVRNSGFDFPTRRITVNLAPADVKKEGAAFDLPMAAGILAASELIPLAPLAGWGLLGELALDGSLRAVKGVLPIAIEARKRGLTGLVLPAANLAEARVVQELKIFPAQSLLEVVRFFKEEIPLPRLPAGPLSPAEEVEELLHDLADVKGQRFAKRALEIAAAGGHNLLMIGPPGAGKTMLSKRLPSLLPPLNFEESIETTKIHSVAGLLPRHRGLIAARPFRSPHHTISDIALVGGGQTPRPGEVSLAHNGVLFLDELPEFHRNALEVLRQPLESREVMIARAKETLVFPAGFMLVAAMNPCPCGFHGHPLRECVCTPYQIRKYMTKISGPLLDRIDIHMEVPALKLDELTEENDGMESSAAVRDRVVRTREIQRKRFDGAARKDGRVHTNSQMSAAQMKSFCRLAPEGRGLLRAAIERLGLSARAYDRVLKVARTIADLEHSEEIGTPHLAEAIQYRCFDRLHP